MPQEAERRRLRDHPREHRRHLGRRLAVGVRQPAVEREQRRLDDERRREAEEDPARRVRPAVDHRERPGLEAVDDHGAEHQQRADHRVDDERDRRAQPPRPAPHADQDVERDQHRLPEDVEEQEILGGEDADDRAGQEEHQPVVGARVVAADPVAVGDRRGHHDDRQPDEPEREPLEHPDVVRDAEILRPRRLARLLQPALVEVEPRDRLDPEADLGERDGERGRPDPDPRHRHDPDHQPPRSAAGGSAWWLSSRTRSSHRDEDEDEDGEAGGDREGVGADEAGLELGGRARRLARAGR